MKVKFNNLNIQWKCVETNVHARWRKLFTNSSYILGDDVQIFEHNFAKFANTQYAAGVANGTDAIKLAVKALQIKHDLQDVLILIPANTYIATALAAADALPDADIEFIDCDEYFQMDARHLDGVLSTIREDYKSCIIIGVHLYGYCIDMARILKLCDAYDCFLIEDAAQAHGVITNVGNAGSGGSIAAFSMYPGKNLGALGDAGIVTTNDQELNDIVCKLRNMGANSKFTYKYRGYNSRLDTLQAIVLDEKLKFLTQWNNYRKNIATWYEELLPEDIPPLTPSYCINPIHHVYPIITHKRDRVREYLTLKEIETGIHYPIIIPKTGIFNSNQQQPNADFYANNLLSLPMHPYISRVEVEHVCKHIKHFL